MKIKIFLSIIIVALMSCKNNTEKTSEKAPEKNTPAKEFSILEKIANAHGYQNWKNINSLEYTFNVDRDTNHYERSWKWWPKKNQVKMMSKEDTMMYTRNSIAGTELKTDKGFVNDKYWLLFPFQLVWDEGFTHTVQQNIEAPISSKKLTEVSINYNKQKGYTPGDTYKIYINDDFIIQEWAFFPKGQETAALTSTWEDYVTKKGLKIAKMHKNKTGSFQLYFSNLKIE
ncbi:hypothetical protein [Mesonia aquimarina]|uniref:hypothetical protein n=1 Tax=Mesonia aquimarina TaxID=1504967 RepID=UPI001F093C24|nr:hypothetical protein [Mesonia aquimarina]